MQPKLNYWPSWIMWAGIIGLFLVDQPFWLAVCCVLVTFGLVTGSDDLLRQKLRDQEDVIEKLHQRVLSLESQKQSSHMDYDYDDDMPPPVNTR